MSEYKIKINWSGFFKHDEVEATDIPEDPGVYEYYSRLKETGRKKKKYVGMADNLRDRFNKHLSEEEENDCLKKLLEGYVWFYRYAIIRNEDERKDAELGLYNKYTYECNKVEPPGSGREPFEIIEDP